jgi:hypothetical protein
MLRGMQMRELTPNERAILQRGSVKGFTAKRLKELGVPWPPPHGWKRWLLGKSKNAVGVAYRPKPAASTRAVEVIPPILSSLLQREKRLTAYWYERMSGAKAWLDGEKEQVMAESEKIAMEINHYIGRQELRSIECAHVSPD